LQQLKAKIKVTEVRGLARGVLFAPDCETRLEGKIDFCRNDLLTTLTPTLCTKIVFDLKQNQKCCNRIIFLKV